MKFLNEIVYVRAMESDTSSIRWNAATDLTNIHKAYTQSKVLKKPRWNHWYYEFSFFFVLVSKQFFFRLLVHVQCCVCSTHKNIHKKKTSRMFTLSISDEICRERKYCLVAGRWDFFLFVHIRPVDYHSHTHTHTHRNQAFFFHILFSSWSLFFFNVAQYKCRNLKPCSYSLSTLFDVLVLSSYSVGFMLVGTSLLQ